MMVRSVEDSPFKAAFVVSKKTASRATERNRIKRLMRESLRLNLDQLRPGYHVVLLATRKAHGELKRQDIDRDLNPILDEAGLCSTNDTSIGNTPTDSTPSEDASLPERVICRIIDLYQQWISPMLGRQCRFRPTCSEYTRQALNKYGLVKGLYLGVKRVLCCHPLSGGGHDPVP